MENKLPPTWKPQLSTLDKKPMMGMKLSPEPLPFTQMAPQDHSPFQDTPTFWRGEASILGTETENSPHSHCHESHSLLSTWYTGLTVGSSPNLVEGREAPGPGPTAHSSSLIRLQPIASVISLVNYQSSFSSQGALGSQTFRPCISHSSHKSPERTLSGSLRREEASLFQGQLGTGDHGDPREPGPVEILLGFSSQALHMLKSFHQLDH